ncbi:hypothetical protein M9H77_10432 [Catharanthus roseus]|uniref:Uncharacterized protein n=1 Tax=Catharanthus roseus TaxID=4058 RepID=A0ACC0BBQ4_CATRO|nr:hypothetical protein M9H77_10432 [Catharanthus roseus]
MRALQSLTGCSVLTSSKISASHVQAFKTGIIVDVFIANNIINGYIKCNELGIALNLFNEMPQRDSASWNTMIAGFVNSGNFLSAWELFKSMKIHGFSFDGYSFGSILKGVACYSYLFVGQQVHSDVVKRGYGENVYAGSALLDMYAKCGTVEDARKVFQYMPERTSVSWNALIAGYTEIGNLESCLQLLKEMEYERVELEDGTFAPVLTLLDDTKFYKLIKQLQAKIMKLGLDFHNTVLNAVITAYSECGSLEDARRVFDSAIGCRDLVSWNSMLGACLEHGQMELAFQLFLEMEQARMEPDMYTYTSIITACSGDQNQGKSVHALVIKRGLEELKSVSNSLIAMYLKSSSNGMEDAIKVFERTDDRDSVSWNSILTGLSQNGLSENALKLFLQMLSENLEIDHYTFSAALRSCSDLAILQLGRQIHVLVIKSGFESNEYVTSALIFMYFKCGILEDARKSFEASPEDSTIAWNSIMFAYAQHGKGEVAINLFFKMIERKVKLDHISFVALLTACSHSGLVEEGQNFLNSMENVYRIPPRMEHYACAIDLLGRAGRIKEAKVLINKMPFEPDPMVWKTLLGACRASGDIEMANDVASHLLKLEPKEHCTYVLLSDMYGHFKKWDEIATVKRLMRDRGVRKIPGWSWIEVEHEVHSFNAQDHSHPYCEEIYQILRELVNEIKRSENFIDPNFYTDYLDDDDCNCSNDLCQFTV